MLETKIITLACQKGGSGKTSNAVNMAYELSLNKKRKILLVDTDPSRDATIAIGFREKEGTYGTLYDLYEENKSEETDIHDIIYPTQFDNLNIIPSADAVNWVEKVATMRSQGDFILTDILDQLRGEYDFIIIDTPPTLSKTLDSALIASDSVLIPIQAEYLASIGAANLIKTIKTIQKRANTKLQIAGAFMTMYDSRNNMSENTLDVINQMYSNKALKNVIRRRIEISYAQKEGKPVQAVYPKGDAARDYKDLVSEVLKINGYAR